MMGTMLPWWFALSVAAPAAEVVPAAAATSASEATANEAVAVPPAPIVAQGPAPVVAQGAAPAPVYVKEPIASPPKGTWMRVGGGLAIGVGAALAVAALTCYATTDALDQDDLAGREVLRLTAFGLGLGALVHIGAGIPLIVVGKQRKRRHDAWAREHVAWRPRIGASAQGWSLGVSLRF
jgi:hypothetical protein